MSNEEKSFPKTLINWYPGHMAKAKRDLKEKMPLVDLVYEVIDARMPLSSKMNDIDELIKGKPRILIMTKYDLCDQSVTNEFISHYESLGYQVVPVDLMSGKNINTILRKSEELQKQENEKRRQKGMKPRSIRVLILGVPNVGKSTLINRLVGKKVVQTGNKPGVTKSNTWIRIHKDIELLDTPGLLWPKLEDQEQASILASLSSIKEEIINLEELSSFILRKLEELYPEQLVERYGLSLPLTDTLEDEFTLIAKKRGALLKGGLVDYNKVYQLIVNDMRDSRVGKITLDRMRKK